MLDFSSFVESFLGWIKRLRDLERQQARARLALEEARGLADFIFLKWLWLPISNMLVILKAAFARLEKDSALAFDTVSDPGRLRDLVLQSVSRFRSEPGLLLLVVLILVVMTVIIAPYLAPAGHGTPAQAGRDGAAARPNETADTKKEQ